jgi:hypothetical protein
MKVKGAVFLNLRHVTLVRRCYMMFYGCETKNVITRFMITKSPYEP